MKISPMPNGSGTAGQNIGSVDVGRTATPMKMERARAIARGEVPPAETTGDSQADRIQNVRKIKMNTRRSTNREEEFIPEQESVAAEPVSSTSEPNEQGVVEATQPFSPQFAALAKQKRALQLEKAQFEKEKAEASGRVTDTTPEIIARLKSEPLSVLQEHGVTYDQLTEAILSGQGGMSPEIQELRAEIKALKEGVDKTLGDRDTQAEQAALAEMRREADSLAREGDSFELVRETKSIPEVMDLIYRTWKKEGEVLDVQEALQLVEDELVKDAVLRASLKKVQNKIAPPPIPQLQPQQRQMTTLTARNSASAQMSARARAIAAFNGTLKR